MFWTLLATSAQRWPFCPSQVPPLLHQAIPGWEIPDMEGSTEKSSNEMGNRPLHCLITAGYPFLVTACSQPLKHAAAIRLREISIEHFRKTRSFRIKEKQRVGFVQ